MTGGGIRGLCFKVQSWDLYCTVKAIVRAIVCTGVLQLG